MKRVPRDKGLGSGSKVTRDLILRADGLTSMDHLNHSLSIFYPRHDKGFRMHIDIEDRPVHHGPNKYMTLSRAEARNSRKPSLPLTWHLCEGTWRISSP